MSELQQTPLHEIHVAMGARFGPFAGYDMPIRFRQGTIAEHLHTRSAASLFDVSHMGVADIHGPDAVTALERLVPADLAAMKEGRVRYTFLTNPTGGIIDDVMVTRGGDYLRLVLNAGRKEVDIDHLGRHLEGDVDLDVRPELAILALQGPAAAAVLSRFAPDVADQGFMMSSETELMGSPAVVSRSGYTGEDGFEIVLGDAAGAFANALLDQEEVEPAGLGARDSLRLEAGLCLYGNDLDESITPVEADLVWAIQKRRRVEGGFLGDRVVLDQIADGPPRVRVGIRPSGRAPVREGAELMAYDRTPAGTVTSGGFGPSVDAPVAMGYVRSELSEPGTALTALQRGREFPCEVARLPFVEHRYHRGG